MEKWKLKSWYFSAVSGNGDTAKSEGGSKKEMTLTLKEFTRRFAQHILPHRFVRIRHYGFLSSTWKRQKLKKSSSAINVVNTKKQWQQNCTNVHVVKRHHDHNRCFW
ncbi:MAG: transposase [Chitinophagaceae bacterium]